VGSIWAVTVNEAVEERNEVSNAFGDSDEQLE
jgi:hypothetical protein